MEEIIITFGQYVEPLIAAAFAAVTGYFLTKIKNGWIKTRVQRLEHAVRTSVREVYQTYVSELKAANADGKLTAEEKAKAKDLAVAKAKSYAGMKGLNILLWVFGLNDELVGGLVEEEVYQAKQDALWAKKS